MSFEFTLISAIMIAVASFAMILAVYSFSLGTAPGSAFISAC